MVSAGMTLKELLNEAGHVCESSATGSKMVFHLPRVGDQPDPRYWSLEDYRVSSTVSGPALILVPFPAPRRKTRFFDMP